MGKRDPAGLLQYVEDGNPVFPCGFHTDFHTFVFGEPACQIVQTVGECGETSLLVLCAIVWVCDADAGIDPCFVNVKTTAILAKNLKRYIEPPVIRLGSSAGTGRPAKSSRFGRDKFTGYVFAPFVDAFTDDRHHIDIRSCRYTSTGSVVC